MRKLLNRKIIEQDRKCAICLEEFTDYNDIVRDHRNPKGMGGAWRDDHPDNIQATHYWCNDEKGSTRMDGRTVVYRQIGSAGLACQLCSVRDVSLFLRANRAEPEIVWPTSGWPTIRGLMAINPFPDTYSFGSAQIELDERIALIALIDTSMKS